MIREDIAALLELERKTKAKMIAPFVHVKRKTFWLWQTRAYHDSGAATTQMGGGRPNLWHAGLTLLIFPPDWHKS